MTSQPIDDVGLDLTAPEEIPAERRRRASRGLLIWLRMRRSPRFWIGSTVVGLLILWAVFGPFLYPWKANQQDLFNTASPPTALHWLGTDAVGNDMYALVMAGLRTSLVIGLTAGPAATLIAAIVGSFAGYLGGRVDAVISWLINLLLVIPSFFILIMVTPALKHFVTVGLIIGIAAFGWMVMGQVVRGQARSLRQRDFVRAARYMGISTPEIIGRHIIPNMASLLIIDATLGVVAAVMSETALSYFGFGIQPPATSIGTLLANNTQAATTQPWMFLSPAVVLVVLLFGVSLVGEAFRDAIDPTSGAARD
jgi:peptide/nickel transport system permease protein